MKKKPVSLFLIFLSCIFLFSACSSKSVPDAGSTSLVSLPAELTATQPRHPSSTEAPTSATQASVGGETQSSPTETNGKKLAAITFDDGPGPYTKYLIEELNKRGAKATFFMLGQNAEKYGDTIQLMCESGHQLGSHTYSHKDITKLSDEQFLDELNRTDEAIKKGCGQIATAFRPPYGNYTKEKLSLQKKTPTHWSVDTMDWKNKNADKIKQHIITHIKDGSIILLHDIYESSVQGALAAIDVLIGEGFQFVTVDELVVRNGDPITPHEIYFSCVPKNKDE